MNNSSEVVSLQALLGNSSSEIIQSFEGISPDNAKAEIVELFVFLIGYVGFSATVDALKTAKEVLMVVATSF